jgi:hypothetical protein
MTAVSALHFTALLLIIGTIIRLIQSRFPDTAIGKALLFIY